MADHRMAVEREGSDLHVRDLLVEYLWRGLTVLAIVGLPASLVRIYVTGWQALYGVHVVTGLAILVTYLYRRRIPTDAKAAIACLAPLTIGLPALWTFGFYSGGIVWIATSCISAALLFNHRIGIAVTVVETLLMLLIAYGFTHGQLVLAIDANAFILRPASWAGAIGGTLIATLALTHGLALYNESNQKLLATVREQRDVIQHQATHDVLTGLPTLRLARDRLAMAVHRATRETSRMAVLFMDLDGFKAANDTYGHDAGDHVLQVVASRVTHSIRAVDSASRQGGDEFIIILNSIAGVQDATVVAEKLIAAIGQPIAYQGHTLQVGASIGIAVYPDHAASPDEVLKLADQAMYSVKKNGKNNYALHTAGAIPVDLLST